MIIISIIVIIMIIMTIMIMIMILLLLGPVKYESDACGVTKMSRRAGETTERI